MKKKYIPGIVKHIQNSRYSPIDYTFQKNISHSQLSRYQECNHRWALTYRDKLKPKESSIQFTFGTALHETIQHYISTIYNTSIAEADRIDLEEYFEDRIREVYQVDFKKNGNTHFSNPEELREFFEDGIEILRDLKKKKGKYFSKRGWYLVGIETPIQSIPNQSQKNLIFEGKLDIVLYHEPTNTFKIIDIKTSKKGWGSWDKNDEMKKNQLIIYKHFLSKSYNIPIDNIKIEFFIVKRQLYENTEFPQSRIQTFSPPSGKIKITKALNILNDFITNAYNPDGTIQTKQFLKSPSEKCKWCPYFQTQHCDQTNA